MRVTNSMIMKSSSNNINATKVNVDSGNKQMTTQKKISRPSDDPVVAVRSLRLGTTLNKLNQYADKNIPDAESWLDVTETAILNMKSIITDVRTQCVTGSTGTLTADDRDTILSQLQSLQKQMYSEGNADYAGRTVFTGFRTDTTLTFQNNEPTTKYNIKEGFSAETDISEMRYYTGSVTVPTTQSEVLTSPISDIEENSYSRIQLPYEKIDKVNEIKYTIAGTENVLDLTGATTKDILDPSTGSVVGQYTESAQTIDGNPCTVYTFDSEEDWAKVIGKKTVGDNDIVIIKNTGDIILGNDVTTYFKQNKASIDLDYDKTGFDAGELRPEFYYNCTDNTNPIDPIPYEKYDASGNLIRYDIEYNIAPNQNLGVNIEAYDVFDSSLIQNVNDMISAVNAAIAAHDKVDKIKSMLKENQYATDNYQAKLKEWQEAAQKEADYADDNIQKLFSSNIGNADKYLGDISIALTKVGCKTDQLSVTRQRVENQQETVEELKSKNDDVDLSQIIIDYTSAYTAYQASLTAAAKLGEVSLLNYI